MAEKFGSGKFIQIYVKQLLMPIAVQFVRAGYVGNISHDV